MRLVVFDADGEDRLGMPFDDSWVLDISQATGSQVSLSDFQQILTDPTQFEPVFDSLRIKARQADQRERPEWMIPRHLIRFRPPVTADARMFATGRNFVAHLEEGNRERRRRGEPEIVIAKSPTAFVKLRASLAGHGEPVPYPRVTTELDYEGEVVAVIGRDAFQVPESEAMDHIAGYVIFNDISARDIQRHEIAAGFLLLGKNLPSFGPIGPEFVTADEIEDPDGMSIQTYVNGDLRQDGSTSQMNFGWKQLVSYWSQLGLRAGDMIASGTPSGVGMALGPDYYLQSGDVVEVRVRQLGSLVNTIGDVA